MPVKSRLIVVAIVLVASVALDAQRPSDERLLIPQDAPPLEYVTVSDPLRLPAGFTMGPAASVALDAKGHVFVLNRGTQPLVEFDPNGAFVRAWGEGLFTRPHGVRVDADGNVWATDVADHVVHKFSPRGQLLLTIGTKGRSDVLIEPTDVVVARNGDVFISQGHTPAANGSARVSRFDRTGRLIATWGRRGSGPGEFTVAHGIAIDAKGLVWVTDREGQRLQVFDADGRFIRQVRVAGLPCSLHIGHDAIHLVNGFAAQLLRLDLSGTVVAAMGRPGRGPGEFGEAHSVAVGPRGEIYVADPVNATVQKFVKR